MTIESSNNQENEKKTRHVRFVRDVIIGMADGITVPFAIAAGLASTGAATNTIIVAGILSEIAAGSISMGLGGFLAAQTEAEHYSTERGRKEREFIESPHINEQEIKRSLHTYGLSEMESQAVAESLKSRKDDWINFKMKFDLGIDEPDRNQSLKSAVTIGVSYIIGGSIPLLPYIFISDLTRALIFSISLTLVALMVFGYLRGVAIGGKPWKSMWQTLIVGGVAALAAFLLAKIVP